MFARQVGFLSATIEGQPQSRIHQLQAVGGDLGLPDLGEGEYLHELMAELGPFRFSGDLKQPTDWDVVAPFGQVIGLDADDMQTLTQMCRGFCAAMREGENPLAIPPVDRVKREKGDADAIR